MKKAGHDQPGLHARRGRQDRPRLPRRSRGGAARGARPRAEQHVRRPLPRDPVRPLERDVRRHGERRRPDPAAAPRPHGDPRDPRLHAAREARDRARSTSSRSSSRSTASRRSSSTITDEAVEEIIDHYTREAGVRTSSARSPSVIRGVAVKVAEGDITPRSDRRRGRPARVPRARPSYTSEVAERTEETGRRDRPRLDERRRRDPLHRGDAHVRHGQAAAHRPARRRHEGVGAGGALLRAHATPRSSASPKDFLEKSDIHIHIPAGGMPKDGPSAGVTMFTALVSLLTGIRVRHDVAMTGEITLRGRVLPDRRPQGEGARGAPRRHQARHHPRAQQGGPRRGAGRGQERPRVHRCIRRWTRSSRPRSRRSSQPKPAPSRAAARRTDAARDRDCGRGDGAAERRSGALRWCTTVAAD